MGERMMPGVAPEEHALPRTDPLHLASLRVRDRHYPFEHMQKLVSGKHGPVLGRMPERAMSRQLEYQRVNQAAGHVDPVSHLTGKWIPPDMPRRACARNPRRPVKCRPRRWAVRRASERTPDCRRHLCARLLTTSILIISS